MGIFNRQLFLCLCFHMLIYNNNNINYLFIHECYRHNTTVDKKTKTKQKNCPRF